MLGLVDAHTHPVWAGDRVHEFAMKVSKTSEYHVIKQQRIHNFWQKIRCLITAKNAIYRIHKIKGICNRLAQVVHPDIQVSIILLLC